MDFGLIILIMMGANLQRTYERILANPNITAAARSFAEDGLKVVAELREMVTGDPGAITQEQRNSLSDKFYDLSVRAQGLQDAGVTLV